MFKSDGIGDGMTILCAFGVGTLERNRNGNGHGHGKAEMDTYTHGWMGKFKRNGA